MFLVTNEAPVVLHGPLGFLLVKSWLRLRFKCHQPHLPPDCRKLRLLNQGMFLFN